MPNEPQGLQIVVEENGGVAEDESHGRLDADVVQERDEEGGERDDVEGAVGEPGDENEASGNVEEGVDDSGVGA